MSKWILTFIFFPVVSFGNICLFGDLPPSRQIFTATSRKALPDILEYESRTFPAAVELNLETSNSTINPTIVAEAMLQVTSKMNTAFGDAPRLLPSPIATSFQIIFESVIQFERFCAELNRVGGGTFSEAFILKYQGQAQPKVKKPKVFTLGSSVLDGPDVLGGADDTSIILE